MKVIPKQRLVRKSDGAAASPAVPVRTSFVSSTIKELQDEYDDGLLHLDVDEPAPSLSKRAAL